MAAICRHTVWIHPPEPNDFKNEGLWCQLIIGSLVCVPTLDLCACSKRMGGLMELEWRFWSSGIERLGSYLAVHDALRFTGKLALQASDWKLSYGHE